MYSKTFRKITDTEYVDGHKSVLIIVYHHMPMKCTLPKQERAANFHFHFWVGILVWSSLKDYWKIKLSHKTERLLSSLIAQLEHFRG